MRKSFLYSILAFTLLVFFTNCTQEISFPQDNAPRVTTQGTENVTATMAKLTGEFTGSNYKSLYFMVSPNQDFISAYTINAEARLEGQSHATAIVSGLSPTTTYYYTLCAEALLPPSKKGNMRKTAKMNGNVQSFITTAKTEEGELLEQIVDLGLSVKWAAWNIGAAKPEEHGKYYAWGEVEEKNDYSLNTYKYYQDSSYINIGNEICGTSYDVAHATWGDGWRLPTLAEIQELLSECFWLWTELHGTRGYRVTGPNGKSIFLPAAGLRHSTIIKGSDASGNYWSGTSMAEGSYNTCGLYFDNEGSYWYSDFNGREYGLNIRPVKDK